MPPPPPPVLLNELLEEVFLRLPPDEPEHLVRTSSVCKPWRGILADPGFRRRYRKLHGTPPVLGFFQNMQQDCRFLPASAFRPARADFRSWVAMDCRHGRVLFIANNRDVKAGFEFVVWDPMTGNEHRVPWPDHMGRNVFFSVAVFCCAERCDHRGCQGREGPFRVAVNYTKWARTVTSACYYSSETGGWSKVTSVHNVHVRCRKENMTSISRNMTSIIVDDALYFNRIGRHIVKYQLATLDMSLFEKPVRCNRGELITTEDGGLGFASLNYITLTLWSMETSPDGAVGWAQHRVIHLMKILPHSALLTPSVPYIISAHGFMDGTQVIFLGAYLSVYMVELKSGRARKVLKQQLGEIKDIFPYASFCIPAVEAASTGQGQ